VTETEKEIREINAKLDRILHAIGLDGSRPQNELREKAKKEVRLWRDKQAVKQAKQGGQTKPCP